MHALVGIASAQDEWNPSLRLQSIRKAQSVQQSIRVKAGLQKQVRTASCREKVHL